MNTDISLLSRSHEENWLPILELAMEEVFEIMLGCRVKPGTKTESSTNGGCTAMVGLAGSLCGILTFSCDSKTARELAKCMLGPEVANSDNEVSDALGEICNMVAGNFASGSAQMKSSSQQVFDRIAALLLKRDCRLRIEGHTDNIPIHNPQFSSNWELSSARATEIVRLLIVRDGYTPDHLSAAGYAEYHPIASNANAVGRGTNRRVDIVILARDVETASNTHSQPIAAGSTSSTSTPTPSTTEAAAPKTPKPSAAVELRRASTRLPPASTR